MPDDFTPDTAPGGDAVPPTRHPPTALEAATPEPAPEPGHAIVRRRGPRLGELLRQAVSLAIDAADELAERARQALGMA